ncbi:hypothetical protein SAY87_005487 [Trapa incisa]|uniref:Uncharacterized protein n=1 Tax=Trapa incisa TaxID=236973 RepID=A0AAN7Q7P8_9MYRT|nr:hypothetical protein SAY87_005487 [Trapa incisa]
MLITPTRRRRSAMSCSAGGLPVSGSFNFTISRSPSIPPSKLYLFPGNQLFFRYSRAARLPLAHLKARGGGYRVLYSSVKTKMASGAVPASFMALHGRESGLGSGKAMDFVRISEVQRNNSRRR